MKKEQIIPVAAGLGGAVLGLYFHKKFPKFGTIGKIAYAGAGGAAGFFIAKKVMEKMGSTTPTAEVPMQNA